MYTNEMLESMKKVEAARAVNVTLDPRRMTADEKDQLLRTYHPDYKESEFTNLEIGPNKGDKVPLELAAILQANPRVNPDAIDLSNPDYDTDVLIIGGGVIPETDIPALKEAGVAEVFTPGTPTSAIVDFIKANVK